MPEQIIPDEPYASVRADTTVPCIVVQLHALSNQQQFKHLLNVGPAYSRLIASPPTGGAGLPTRAT